VTGYGAHRTYYPVGTGNYFAGALTVRVQYCS